MTNLATQKAVALNALEKEYQIKREAIINAFALIEGLGASEDVSTASATLSTPVESKESKESVVDMALSARTGSDVARIRKAMGMTQAQFAELWGSTQANVSTMENNNGSLRTKSILKLSKIVQAYAQYGA